MKKLTEAQIYFIIIQLLIVGTLLIFASSLSDIFFYSTERLMHTPTDVKMTAIVGTIVSTLMSIGILINVFKTFNFRLSNKKI